MKKPGEPAGETAVVCLDCGKQFVYDWNHMRIGKPIKRSPESGVLDPEMPPAPKTKIKYALLGSAIPLAIMVGRGVAARRRERRPPITPLSSAGLDRRIELLHGGPGAAFNLRDLVARIEQSDRDYIIIGLVDCALADHPMPSSLDYWIRENFAKNKEIKQATPEVIKQLIATGLFEAVRDLRCPDTGDKSVGLRLKSRPPAPVFDPTAA